VRSNLEWHFIGPLQSNKTRPVANAFDWVHGIDRLKIAERLSAQRDVHLPPLNVCLQVNVSGEDQQERRARRRKLRELAHAIAALPNLRLRGLMCIPEPVHRRIPCCAAAPFACCAGCTTNCATPGLCRSTPCRWACRTT
jgi:uncharacterized pyridoxal phosphate-containing UPF0001 family protein